MTPLIISILSPLSSQLAPTQIQAPSAGPAEISPQELAVLEQLVDIQTPAPIAMWPPSIWALLALSLFLITLFASVYFVIKHHRANQYRRYALTALTTLETEASQDGPSERIEKLNILLKQVCFSYEPSLRRSVSKLYGSAWYAFLNQQLPKLESLHLNDSLIVDLTRAQYGKASDSFELPAKKLHDFSRFWIRKHKGIYPPHATAPNTTNKVEGLV